MDQTLTSSPPIISQAGWRKRGRILWAITLKDIVYAVKNPYIVSGLVTPILMGVLFRLVFSAQLSATSTLAIAVYDPGNSRLVAALRALPEVTIIEVASEDQLSQIVEKEADGGLSIPRGFDDAVRTGQRPELLAYQNQQRGDTTLFALQHLIEQQVLALAVEDRPAAITWTGLANRTEQFQDKFALNHYLLVMLLIMSLSMACTCIATLMLVEEKEKRTWRALLVSPASMRDILAGKALTSLFFGLVSVLVMLVLYRGWTGHWLITALAVSLGTSFLVLVGLVVGSLLHTQTQASAYCSIVALAFLMPSWAGVLPLPPALESLMRFIPTFYLADALHLALANSASTRIWSDLAVLAASTLAAFAALLWVLRHQEKREYWLEGKEQLA